MGHRVGKLIPLVAIALVVAGGTALAAERTVDRRRPPGRGSGLAFEVQSLDGSGNNRAHSDWGRSGKPYSRVAPAVYADGRGAMVQGPNVRWISNRVFNDSHQNVFNDRRVSQWGFVWGQFVDHTVGLRDAPPDEQPPPGAADIVFNAADPLETFSNTLGVIPFNRSNAAPGGGVRQQTNLVSSYVDAWAVYGGTDARLEWLREGPVDGNMANNGPHLLLPGGYLPRRDSRGDASTAPTMSIDGLLRGRPGRAMVAGDVRANENIGLTAVQTLFAREHNRIVDKLPAGLTAEQKFQIARRVVIAEQQYITYEQFLPAMGVRLPQYRGYKPDVDATLSNEFATVGYRAHSMIHGELEMSSDTDRYPAAQLEAFQKQGVEVTVDGDEVELAVPLNVAYFNPDLVPAVQLGPLLRGIGGESEYRNDEQIDNQLRSVLFQIPVPGNPRCLDGAELPDCFTSVVDLGAVDVLRGRDHGMPGYNDLRRAYGLQPRRSFRAITGEPTDAFPRDPTLTAGKEIDDPNSLDFTALFDIEGKRIAPAEEAAETSVTRATRRTALAARLKAVYGSVDRVDAFVGMVSEPHVPGTEFGELQLAIWTRQFQALRDGDRFFYRNDPGLTFIRRAYGLDYRRNLGDVIADNTDIPRAELERNVFFAPPV
ncbi:peroxidase family protein [Dactylosporangium sp. AC04546]|uniref:peroxidase family protein n=1 Tax=Dactylosporangium sp. AC04546 TaxID=2862460 RepID=UPI001EDE08D2|nr:peroxidase family protein [Dactylosporangium sp. AC04546]WVK81815.1 peroxidase family protein [Dactylosporangium sp. AC04546]